MTHVKQLNPEATSAPQTMLDQFAPLAEKQEPKPILLQLPPNFKRNNDRLGKFFHGLSAAYR